MTNSACNICGNDAEYVKVARTMFYRVATRPSGDDWLDDLCVRCVTWAAEAFQRLDQAIPPLKIDRLARMF